MAAPHHYHSPRRRAEPTALFLISEFPLKIHALVHANRPHHLTIRRRFENAFDIVNLATACEGQDRRGGSWFVSGQSHGPLQAHAATHSIEISYRDGLS
jgi:hypothetical protein